MPVKCIFLPDAAGRGADREIGERSAGVGAAAFPLSDDVVAFGDRIGGATEPCAPAVRSRRHVP